MSELPAKILHVDDNDANRYAVTRTLIKAGFEVAEAATGSEALAKAEDLPDLVILDIRLPDIDGFEVCRRIKADPRTANTPILHLSASYVTGQDKAFGLDSGADGYLIRPVEPVELVATVKALLRARRSEDALRESESRFRELANAMPQIVWTARPDGTLDYYNDRWYEFTSSARGESIDSSQQVLHPDDVQATRESWDAAVRTGSLYQIENRFLHRSSGMYRWHLGRAVPVRDAAGTIVKWFGTATDIEDQKQTEAALRRATEAAETDRARAESANRLKDDFLATLSHELRTPLNAIVGWSTLLKGSKIDDEDLAEGLATIERNARLQSQLIDDLLDVSRIISGKLRLDVQQVELPAVIEAVIASVYPAADAKGIRIQRVLDQSGTIVLGDPARLQQVVWNLLSNAIKFTPRGGRVHVALHRVNSHVEIVVTDTGAGLAANFVPYVFDRFRQADASTTRRHGGLGLGLAIVRHLVELHGGTVHAASAGEGSGSTFTVAFPITVVRQATDEGAAVESALPQAPPHVGFNAALDGVRVIVVDDEADSRRLLRRILEGSHAIVTTAYSAAAAMDEFRRGRFDVLISDIGMPEVDGYDLIRDVRALPPEAGGNVPAVALTAFARLEDRRRALAAGFTIHVSKPVDPSELLAVIASLSGRTGRSTHPGDA